MKLRYSDVVKDLSVLPAFLSQFDYELDEARKEISISGNVEKSISRLPGQSEHRFNQLQELEAVLRFLELEVRRIRKKHFKAYLEGYARALTSRDAEKYVDGEDEVITYELLINEVSLVRNKWMGVMKGLEQKSFMLGHITRLRTAGMEDVTL